MSRAFGARRRASKLASGRRISDGRRRIAGSREQVAQERLDRLERIGTAEIEQDDRDLHDADGVQLRTISTSWATCSGGVCGTTPWPRLKMNGPWPSLSRMRLASRSSAGAADQQHDRIEVALHADLRLQLARRPVRADAGVDRQRGEGVGAPVHQRRRTDQAGKGEDRHVRMACAHRMGDAHHRLDRPAEQLLLGQHPGPRIEQLHGVGAGIDLVGEMVDHRLDQEVDQKAERIRDGGRPSSSPWRSRALAPPSIM